MTTSHRLFRTGLVSAGLLAVQTLFGQIAGAVVNTADYLIVTDGENYSVTGEIHKNILIYVEGGGKLIVKQPDNVEAFGNVNLIAPQIIIQGSIYAVGAGYNDTGAGRAPTLEYAGGGGGGYGGAGGAGAGITAGGAGRGLGGNAYDNYYAEDCGSYGFRSIISSVYGHAGGSIRLDAISLTITSSASIIARGTQITQEGTGGGSGGCIYLNGIMTYLGASYSFSVRGGNGGDTSTEMKYIYGAAGGGGGGRIKYIMHNNFTDDGSAANLSFEGGDAGTYNGMGMDPENGADGVFSAIPAPEPNAPVLINPDDNSIVGAQPDFAFIATDPANSKFLKYAIQLSLDSTFSSLTITSSQVNQPGDPGWNNKPYFRSNEQATYAITNGALAYGQEYYWRVAVSNNNGETWIPSATYRRISTTSVPNDPPLVPVLITPAHQESSVSILPELQVMAADPDGDTLTFKISISTNPDLLNPQEFEASYPGWNASAYYPEGTYLAVTATLQILNSEPHFDILQPGIAYYWGVNAIDKYSQSTGSGIRTFTTVKRPSVPVVSAPGNSTVVTTRTPSLRMLSSSPTLSSLQYKVELSSDNYQTVLRFTSENGGGWSQITYADGQTAELLIPDAYALIPGTDYIWRVYAYDLDNALWSLPSADYTFTVITPPLTPELLSPADAYEAPNSAMTFQMTVETESGTTLTGRLEISDNQFSTTLFSFDQSTDTNGWDGTDFTSGQVVSYHLPAYVSLDRGKTYWWRFQAYDGVSWGPRSDYRRFSLAEKLKVSQVKLAPNPAVSTNTLQIFIQTSVDAELFLRFFNKLGHEIDQCRFNGYGGEIGNVFTVSIADFASGIYYCTIEAKSDFGTQRLTKRFAVIK